MTESQLNTVYEMTEFSKSIACRSTRPTKEQEGRTWDGQSRMSHSSEIILIQQTCQLEVQNMQKIALQQD
jgi:hypothetical protein